MELPERKVYSKHQAREPELGRLLQAFTGLLDNPVADRHDQAAALGDRNEFVRSHQPPLRVVPAQQALNTTDFFSGQINPGLIVKLQFLAPQGIAQVGLEPKLIAGRDMQLPVVEAITG